MKIPPISIKNLKKSTAVLRNSTGRNIPEENIKYDRKRIPLYNVNEVQWYFLWILLNIRGESLIIRDYHKKNIVVLLIVSKMCDFEGKIL